MEKRLLDELLAYSKSDYAPMHMPGHKRNVSVDYLDILNANLDITEIEGFDNLHNPTGIIKEAMDRAAKVYKSDNTFFLINGSSCGILAGMKACLKYGDEIIMARNCHKSVYHGVELLGLTPFYIYPKECGNGILGEVDSNEVAQMVAKHPKIKLVIITSPTYEGVISDIEKIAKICHRAGIPLMVDEAHGAHLGFSDFFGKSARSLGADIVINSLHKTMPSLTQTALAHINGDLVDSEEFARNLSIFESSSPSYLLMAAIDGCMNLLEEKGDELFGTYEENVRWFYESTFLEKLKLFRCENKDPGKIVVLTKGYIDGNELADILRSQYKIEVEMSLSNYLIAMTGLLEKKEGLLRLSVALLEIDKMLKEKRNEREELIYTCKEEYPVSITQAVNISKELVKIEDSFGRISGEYVYAYPPGIPVVVPGQRISRGNVEWMRDIGVNDVKLLVVNF